MQDLTVKHRLLKIDNLPEEDRVCNICYYEFGQRSLDGVREEPCSLLPCKHIFGSHCIGKWLVESSKCPYCRAHLRKLSSAMKSSSTERPLTGTSGESPKAYVDRQVPETERDNMTPISRVIRRPFKQPPLISQLSRLQHTGNEGSEVFPPTHSRHWRPTTTQRVCGKSSRKSPSIDRHRRRLIVTYSARRTGLLKEDNSCALRADCAFSE